MPATKGTLRLKAVNNFWIDDKKVSTFNKEKVHRIRSVKDIFSPPMLLCRKALDTKRFILKSAISYQKAIFKDSITSIRAYNGNLSILKNISCIGASKLFSYLAINTFSSIGIEREQSQNEDKFDFPYVELSKDSYGTFERIYKEQYDAKQKDIIDSVKIQQLDELIENKYDELNEEICDTLHMQEVEKDLINYTLDISMPLITKSNGYKNIFNAIKLGDQQLKEYAQVYINRFANSFNRNGKRFTVEILYSKQVIGMYFKVIDENMFINDIVYASDNEDLLPIIALTSEKLTDALFVQKDVRGFEKEYFYIFKPNEKRLWHKAIAYLDVNEFADAMLKTGGDY